MISAIIAKLPSRNLKQTAEFYQQKIGFKLIAQFPDYLLMSKDNQELHFFLFTQLNPKENWGAVYVRIESNIEQVYNQIATQEVNIVTPLALKPWQQKEFAIIDEDGNLLTFGEAVT